MTTGSKLTELSALTGGAEQTDLLYLVRGTDQYKAAVSELRLVLTQLTGSSAIGRSVLAGADAAAIRTLLSLGALATLAQVGTAQIADAAVTLAKLDALASGAMIVGDGSNRPSSFATAAFGRSLLALTDAVAGRAALGVGGLAFSATADATVANSTAEASIVGAGVGSMTLAAALLTAGRTVRVRVSGILSDTGTPSLNIKLKLGSTVLAQTGAVALSGTVNDREFDLECLLVCRTAGATGTVMASGAFHYDNAASDGPTMGLGITAPVVIDTTVSQLVDVTATWGTADAANTITGQICTLEIVN